ncbi:MAG: NuoE [Ignavibacteria bacterium]|nr:NuoE [Ignavibacteria bacterium]
MEQNEKIKFEKEIKNFKVDLFEKKDMQGSLIPLLQSAQDSYGYIPEQAIYYISEMTSVPAADIYGVITFYAQFRLKPLGKNLIRICEGTACHVNGAKRILSALEDELGCGVDDTTDDGFFTLLSVACIGCCSLSPVIMVNDDTHGSLAPDKIKRVLKTYKNRKN